MNTLSRRQEQALQAIIDGYSQGRPVALIDVEEWFDDRGIPKSSAIRALEGLKKKGFASQVRLFGAWVPHYDLEGQNIQVALVYV